MQLRRLDLNLLVSLDALLAERSVTRAAERLGISQPTMSAALARLRRHFSDELLCRSGNRYELTALAEQLRPLVGSVLSGAERVFSSLADFDPATTDREFTIMSSDYGLAVAGPVMHEVLTAASPGARLRLRPLTLDALQAFEDSLHAIDIILLPHGVLQAGPHLDLLTDEWVAVVGADNPHVGETLEMVDLTQLSWVVTSAGPASTSASVETIPVIRQLELLGIRPAVSAVTESFVVAALLVGSSDRMTVVQRRLAERLAASGALRVLPLPFDAVPLVEAAWWHPAHERDAGHRWLRSRLERAAAQLST